MTNIRAPQECLDCGQFGLAALLEYVAVCAILLAFAGMVGVLPSLFLMAMALALAAGRGMLALAMCILASLLADWAFDSGAVEISFLRQIMLMLFAALLCVWYRLRRSGFLALHWERDPMRPPSQPGTTDEVKRTSIRAIRRGAASSFNRDPEESAEKVAAPTASCVTLASRQHNHSCKR